MPATSEKAMFTSRESSAPTRADVAVCAFDLVAPAVDTTCDCDACQDVDRDEMWSRWA